jgi:hypothetical protein
MLGLADLAEILELDVVLEGIGGSAGSTTVRSISPLGSSGSTLEAPTRT